MRQGAAWRRARDPAPPVAETSQVEGLGEGDRLGRDGALLGLRRGKHVERDAVEVAVVERGPLPREEALCRGGHEVPEGPDGRKSCRCHSSMLVAMTVQDKQLFLGDT